MSLPSSGRCSREGLCSNPNPRKSRSMEPGTVQTALKTREQTAEFHGGTVNLIPIPPLWKSSRKILPFYSWKGLEKSWNGLSSEAPSNPKRSGILGCKNHDATSVSGSKGIFKFLGFPGRIKKSFSWKRNSHPKKPWMSGDGEWILYRIQKSKFCWD